MAYGTLYRAYLRLKARLYDLRKREHNYRCGRACCLFRSPQISLEQWKHYPTGSIDKDEKKRYK